MSLDTTRPVVSKQEPIPTKSKSREIRSNGITTASVFAIGAGSAIEEEDALTSEPERQNFPVPAFGVLSLEEEDDDEAGEATGVPAQSTELKVAMGEKRSRWWRMGRSSKERTLCRRRDSMEAVGVAALRLRPGKPITTCSVEDPRKHLSFPFSGAE
ncbi:hypothetical protein CDL15_Pgr014688 [Punica granatum]|uniref:Uncharacterized protein n=1 Tax=Punica granatum TaxID=22663 RepID=A0A218Y0J5_PUNGR|nr:hypothetical protein CDL15_Pgr014688 [Punica granatum]